MEEVKATLRFTRECLGAARDRQNVFRFLRGPDGRVMFLPSWWRERMLYAAQVLNQSDALVKRITWSPFVDGTPTGGWKRVLPVGRGNRRIYAVHDAFRRGETITVRAILPDGLSRNAFTAMLRLVGEYRGISPFRDDDPYGTFEVIAVEPATDIT